MSDYQSQINKLVEEFVSQITQVARQAAMETLNVALGTAGRVKRGGAAVAVVGNGAKSSARRAKGAKRPQAEIETAKEQVHEFIRKNPGLRIEQINKELGTSTRDLSLPLKKLISDGAVRTEGEKRSTQYFPGEGGGKGSRSEGAAAPKRRKKK